MSRRADASRAHKYARGSWDTGDPMRVGGLDAPTCRHDRGDPSCDHDWRDDDVAVAALRVLVASRGDVMSVGRVRLALLHEHGMEVRDRRVRRSLYLLGRHHLAHRETTGDTDTEGRPIFRWRASMTPAREALASVAA